MKNKGGRRPHGITKEQILRAMEVTHSNMEAARYLHVSYQSYKKYAKLYVDQETGETLFEKHKNIGGRGVPKYLPQKGNREDRVEVQNIIEGKIETYNFDPQKLKYKFIRAGYLPEKCNMCGFSGRRTLDYKIPLILHFKDGNKNNYKLDNIQLICYNCYFLHVADVFTDSDLKKLETKMNPQETTPTSNLELDDYNLERLKNLSIFEDSEEREEDEYSILSPNYDKEKIKKS